MTLNPDMCNLLISRHKYKQVWEKIGEERIWETNESLGIVIEQQLKFDRHVSNLCSKANNKLSV